MRKIKKKDIVILIAGKDKGKKGEVISTDYKNNKVIVSKINIVKKHAKPTQNEPGGIKEIEAPIHISNVQLICPKCSKPTKVKIGKTNDGKKVRICKKCGEMIL
jgi:large subunit ribosomal protein L24